MARGERTIISGLLLDDGCSLVLRTDDGGTWRLEAMQSHAGLVGCRVMVTGIRDGFDLIAVMRIDRA